MNFQANFMVKIPSSDSGVIFSQFFVFAILQETLLHLAEKHSSQTVVSALIQLYRDASLLSDVLSHKSTDQCNPLRQSILNGHFENTVLLFKECLSVAKDAITTIDDNGHYNIYI